MNADVAIQPLWTPPPGRIARANLTAFAARARRDWGREVQDYQSLYAWSVAFPTEFWAAVWRFCGVRAAEGPGQEPWDAVGIGLGRIARRIRSRGRACSRGHV